MNVYINNKPTSLDINNPMLSELIAIAKIPTIGAAIAINDHLIVRSKWNDTVVHENDNIVIISAAFGG